MIHNNIRRRFDYSGTFSCRQKSSRGNVKIETFSSAIVHLCILMCFESVTISFELRMTQNRVGERPSYIQPFGSLFLSQKHFLVFLRKNDRERSPWEENRLSSRRSRIFLAPHKKIARMTSHCDRVTFCARKSKSCRESTVLRACHAQVRGGRFHDGNEITGMMDSAGSKRLFNPRNAVRVWNWWLEPQCLADREQKKVRGKEP